MNPKEKAKELIDNYIEIMPSLEKQTSYAIKEHAKRCSMMLSVESIMGILSIIGSESHMWTSHEKETILFWESVKKELVLL